MSVCKAVMVQGALIGALSSTNESGARAARHFLRWELAGPAASASLRPLFTFLRSAVERLRNALERERVGGRGSLRGLGLDHGVAGLAHGLDQPRLFGGVLDPGAVVLGVHREAAAADGHGRFGVGLEGIAGDQNRNLVGHL